MILYLYYINIIIRLSWIMIIIIYFDYFATLLVIYISMSDVL